MTSKKMFYVLVGICVLLAGLSIFVTYQGSVMLKSKGDALLNLKLENAVLSEKEVALVRAKKDIQTYSDLEAIAKTIVPQEKDQARTIREIVTIADQSGVPLSAIQFPESALGEVKKSGKTKSAGSSDPAKSQLTEVEGIKGLYAMNVTVVSDTEHPVNYSQMLTMLRKLEQNRRTAHVTDISISPSEDNRNAVTFTLTVTVYIKP